MKTSKNKEISLLDDEMLILPAPTYTASERPLLTNENDVPSIVLIRSALDRLHNRHHEIPYILQQWAD